MERENERARSFTRRAFVIGGLQAVFLGILGGRLVWLQVAQGQHYKVLAENNRINLKLLPPSRGYIVDRYGRPMAVNGQNFRAMIVPEQTTDLETALSRLQKILPVSQYDIQRVLKQARKNPSFMPIEIKDNLEWEDVARVEVNVPDLRGIFVDEGEIRHYPMGPATAHLLGYVGAVSQAEAEQDPLFSLPGFVVGKTGIEKAFDQELRGRAGTAEVEVNVAGREVRELKRNQGQPGEKLALSVDYELQQFVYDRLSKEKSASAVIMDAHDGAVYALGSYPGFDPNVFARGISAELWEGLLADPGLPLNNKAVAGQYPPGSTFKMVTALAALEKGIISRHTTCFCPGHYDFGNSRFHCWKRGGHGTVDLIKALTESCDTYFYKIATDLGVDDLAVCAGKLGLGQKYDFDLPEEKAGLIPTREWKKKQTGESWQPGESIVTVIGQGYNLTTPLQLAVMTARLVNGGRGVKPWMAVPQSQASAQGQEWPELNFKKEHLDLIMKGMERVVSSPTGTAHSSRLPQEEFQMGGKTGTAQVKRITREERLEGVQNQDLPWKFRHHALFVGYAPVHNPRYVCSVVVEHGVGGALAAAPIARDILRKVQELDPASRALSVFGEEEKRKFTPGRKPNKGKLGING